MSMHRGRCVRVLRFFVALAAIWLLAASPAIAQTLTTDKPDYQPGETCILVGTGFAPGENVTMQVLHAGGAPSVGAAHLPWTAAANAGGYVITTWLVSPECAGALLRATADGVTSSLHAEVLFTDATGTGVV